MSTLKLDTLSNKAGTASVPSDTIVSGTAKAWVNFNGTGTVAIRRAFNVSSITDNGTGDYTVNFTNAMSDANYIMAGSMSATAGATYAVWTHTMSTSSIRVQSGNYGAYVDGLIMSVAIFS